MTLEQEQRILASDCTHFLVTDVVNATEGKDLVDAVYDVECALAILKGRLNRLKAVGY